MIKEKYKKTANLLRSLLLPKNLLAFLVLVSTILLVSFIRFRLLGVPLERDEGEYAYMGQLLLQGILPYTEAYNMKFPGIYFVYAVILSIFGQTPTGIHFALLFVNIASAILLFLLGRFLFNTIAGTVAGVSFLLMTLSPSVQGLWANAEHFVLLPAICGILIMLIAVDKDNKKLLFLSGFLLGIAFLVKQHGIFFGLASLVYICRRHFKKEGISFNRLLFKAGLFIAGVIIPLCIIALLFLMAGNFNKFWFWTFKYASEYVSMTSMPQGIANFNMAITKIIKPDLIITVMALFGLAEIVSDREKRATLSFVLLFAAASFFSVCPGLYFRPHYFVLLIPAISLLAGIGVFYMIRHLLPYKLLTAVVYCIIAIAFIYPVISQQNFFFGLSEVEACRTVYGKSPFPESLEIARYIEKNTTEKEAILVLGSEPQIYFYSKRRAATGYIYIYPLMEPHRLALQMQKEMIDEIKRNNPKFIIYVNHHGSWLDQPKSEKLLTSWLTGFIKQNYQTTGIVDTISNDKVIYKWEDSAVSYRSHSSYFIVIYAKKIS